MNTENWRGTSRSQQEPSKWTCEMDWSYKEILVAIATWTGVTPVLEEVMPALEEANMMLSSAATPGQAVQRVLIADFSLCQHDMKRAFVGFGDAPAIYDFLDMNHIQSFVVFGGFWLKPGRALINQALRVGNRTYNPVVVETLVHAHHHVKATFNVK